MMVFKTFTVPKMLILPSLIGVENKAIKVVELLEGFVKHVINLFEIGACGDVMRYYLAIIHVKYR